MLVARPQVIAAGSNDETGDHHETASEETSRRLNSTSRRGYVNRRREAEALLDRPFGVTSCGCLCVTAQPRLGQHREAARTCIP